ncbi:MAG: hypothetical protein AAGG51_24340 [Cyanobacteria bacterium P01_G01_bin.54]
MTIETSILRNDKKLPDSVKQAVFLDTEFLASQYAAIQPDESSGKPNQCPLESSMKGTFLLPLPKDFDLPEALMTPDQKAKLEEKYGYESMAGQIIMSEGFDDPLEDLKDYM